MEDDATSQHERAVKLWISTQVELLGGAIVPLLVLWLFNMLLFVFLNKFISDGTYVPVYKSKFAALPTHGLIATQVRAPPELF